jgi:Arc/MetJ-type ribon-helix-helix transcriptional regulator
VTRISALRDRALAELTAAHDSDTDAKIAKRNDTMTIHLPDDLETSIRAAVQGGRFASVDDAMAEAARLLLRTITPETNPSPTPDPLQGIWRDAPEEIDEIVAEAMQRRREETVRAIPGE